MRNLIYIGIVLLCLSCSNQEHNLNPSVESSNVMVNTVEENESNVNVMENDVYMETDNVAGKANNSESDVYIEHQLQETLNLIVLKNKMKLNKELKSELDETIKDKVQSDNVDSTLDISEIRNLQIVHETLLNGDQHIDISFEVEDPEKKLISGKADAVLRLDKVTIDGNTYTKHDIFFDHITIK